MIEYMPEMTITNGIYTYNSEDPGKGKQGKEYHGRVVKVFRGYRIKIPTYQDRRNGEILPERSDGLRSKAEASQLGLR